jgi:chromosome segregation ATPase
VREALGGGSFSTINPILKEWKEQQSTSEQPSLELPPEAMQAVTQAAGLIWKIASDKSTELTNSIKTEFETLLKEANAEKEEALKEIARLEQTTAKLTADLEKSLKEHQSLILQVQKQQLVLDASEGKAAELKEEMKTLRSDLREASNEAAMLQGKLSVYEKKQLNV